MNNRFVHLHIHSEFSLEDGLIKIDKLVDALVSDQMPAAAITEQGNFFSAVKFYCAAEARGIKPIIGVDLHIGDPGTGKVSGDLVLLCQDYQGYKNLNALITRSYREGHQHNVALIHKDWLSDAATGLIALSGAQYGDIGRALVAGSDDRAKALLYEWLEIFGDRFYLELHRTEHHEENAYIHAAVGLASQCKVPVVATNNVRFLNTTEYEAHEARVCIHQGYALGDSKRPMFYTDKQYLRSADEMIALFSDIPEAIENTLAVAKRCNLELTLGKSDLPDFPVPDEFDQNGWLAHEAKKNLDQKLVINDDDDLSEVQDLYHTRLEYELSVITEMGFAGYFLIVADFIQWAKDHAIPVGPGRGSGAGSLVAYALGITTIDPVKYGLLFERFLNPERVSLPDFDVDFCMERRDEVTEYVTRKYGHDRVSQIVTFGSMAAKAAIRDAGRVLGKPYGFVDKIAKLIPWKPEMTLTLALATEEALKQRYGEEEEVSALIDLAQKLEGIPRNAGRHAGGIVISPKPLTDYMPLYSEHNSNLPVAQFDMEDIEKIGLVKFDFLGLRTLTVIDWTVRNIHRMAEQGEAMIDIDHIPLDDDKTYTLIRSNKTTAVFQLESDGMKKLIKRLQPDTFDDLVALLALFRPGPLQSGMVDSYIDCKHGTKPITYPHPKLEHILKPTNGVILYQEQVMQIAEVLAGYSPGEADLLRRAMGKKKPEEMAMQRTTFTRRATENGVQQKLAVNIFDLMEKFAGYGFNKSHSTAYAIIAYQTAWLKTHYPAHFMAASLSSDMHDTDKIVMLRDEIEAMGLALKAPSINHSDYKFTVEDPRTIRFGLGAIKGVGEGAVENIIESRTAKGAFVDLFDLCHRIDPKRVNRRVLEPLICAGATDELGSGRSHIHASLDQAVRLAEQSSKARCSGQNDLFGLFDTDDCADTEPPPLVNVTHWSDEKRLIGEKEALGFYLEGHPIMKYENELTGLISVKLKDIKEGPPVRVAGYVYRLRTRAGRQGKMAEVYLDDRTARASVVVFPNTFQKYGGYLIKDRLVIIDGKVVEDDLSTNELAIHANAIYTLAQVREYAKLELRLSKREDFRRNTIEPLRDILLPHRQGKSGVSVVYQNDAGYGVLVFGDEWRVAVSDVLLQSLQDHFGPDTVYVRYPDPLVMGRSGTK